MTDSGGSSQLPQLLITTAEREQAQALLKEAYLDGRLTVDEFGERIDLVERVRTRDQLQTVIADLGVVAPVAPTKPSTKVSIGSVVAIMSAVERGSSRWVVPATNRVFTLMGECKLDLSEATLTSQVTTIRTGIVMGALKVIVPEGVAVEVDALAIMGEAKSRASEPHPDSAAPVVRITGLVLMGAVNVEVRKRRGTNPRLSGGTKPRLELE